MNLFDSTDFGFINENSSIDFMNDSFGIDQLDDYTQLNNIFNKNNNSYTNIYEIPNINFIEQNKHKQKNPSNNFEKNIKLLGRKTKNSSETGKHNKYSEDNKAKKSKILLKNDLLEFINDKIKTELNYQRL